MKTDVVIIGAGIAGLTAALYFQRANIDYKIIDDTYGGQVSKIPCLENYPGFVGPGVKLIDNIFSQLGNEFTDKHFCLNHVINIQRDDSGEYIVFLEDSEIHCSFIIDATGCKSRKLPILNGDDPRIHYCVTCDGPFYRDKEVIVVGDGSSAWTYAIELATYCKKVTILTLTDQIYAELALQKKLLQFDNVEIQSHKEITQLEFLSNDKVVARCGDNSHVTADGIFVAIGYEELPMTKLESNNFYYAGDRTLKQHKQVVLAAASGCEVALDIIDKIKQNNY